MTGKPDSVITLIRKEPPVIENWITCYQNLTSVHNHQKDG